MACNLCVFPDFGLPKVRSFSFQLWKPQSSSERVCRAALAGSLFFKGVERLVPRQLRLAQHLADPVLLAFFTLTLDQLMQIALMA